MPPKTPIAPSVTSPNNTSPKKKLKNKSTSPDINWQCQALWPSMKGQKEMGENVHQPCKRRKPSRNQCQNRGLSKSARFKHRNSEDTTTAATCQSEWTTKAQAWNWCGKWPYKTWTTTTICRSSWTDVGRKSTHIEVSLFWEWTICCKRVETRSYQLFLSWSFQLRVIFVVMQLLWTPGIQIL